MADFAPVDARKANLEKLEQLKPQLDAVLGDKKFVPKEDVIKSLGENAANMYVTFKKQIWTDETLGLGYLKDLAKKHQLNEGDTTLLLQQNDDKKPTEAALKKVQGILVVPQSGVMDEATKTAVIKDKNEWWTDASYTPSVKNSFEQHIQAEKKGIIGDEINKIREAAGEVGIKIDPKPVPDVISPNPLPNNQDIQRETNSPSP